MNYLWRDGGAEDATLRATKARLMRSMAQATTSSIQRGFLLSQARAYEGLVLVPKVVAPQAEQVAAQPADFVSRHRVRIDPLKAADIDALLRFEFPGQGAVALHIRRGVADFVADPDAYGRSADQTLRLSGEAWRQLYVNEAELADLVTAGQAEVEGDVAGAQVLLDLFDRLNPAKNTILQPPQSIHAP